jgi:hypothetical protein
MFQNNNSNIRRWLTPLLIAALAVCFVAAAWADVPPLMNYQGTLLDAQQNPVTTATGVVFTIWDTPSGGASLWSEERSITPDAQGQFSIKLGEVTPITDAVFASPGTYLGIRISSETSEMTPRTRLVTVPYAFRTSTVDSASGGSIVGDVKVAGWVGIGTSAPQATLDVAGNVSIGNGTDPSTSVLHIHGDEDGGVGITIKNSNVGASSSEYLTFQDDDGYCGINVRDADFSSQPSAMQFTNNRGTASHMRWTINGGMPMMLTSSSLDLTCLLNVDGQVRITGGNPGAGKVLTSDAGGNATWQNPSGAGNNWTLTGGDVLYTNGQWGIARSGNTLYGIYDYTHVNLGRGSSTTGTSGLDVRDATVSGGAGNVASGEGTTVCGGQGNTASNTGSVVSGGVGNSALGNCSVVSGGNLDTAMGSFSTVLGGILNVASSSSLAAGTRAKAYHSGSFVWADGRWSDFASTAADQFLVRAGGGVGINANDPTAALDVNGQVRIRGGTPGAGKVLTSDVDGNATWEIASGADNDWTLTGGDVLYTNGPWGIARSGNILYGSNDSTHINLGVASTTGAPGFNYKYATVSGGSYNLASQPHSTVSGGEQNAATDMYATVCGGDRDTASAFGATVSGGQGNTASGALGTVSGGLRNSSSELGATVSGGHFDTASGIFATVSGGYQNVASGDSATISGGFANTASANNASVSGGSHNTASGTYSSIGGGLYNFAIGTGATVSGGIYNTATSNYTPPMVSFATVAGGCYNKAGGNNAAVSGGEYDSANGQFAMIPGGYNNKAAGDYSFAAGRRAKANDNGSFVWGDGTNADVSSWGANTWTARSAGGTRFYSNTAMSMGVQLSAGSGAWAAISDSTLKRNIRPVDGGEVLEKLEELPVSRWSYESQDDSIEHIGPMAQDFYRLFGLGEDDTHISTLDPDGIALVAIKELNNKVKEIEQLRSEKAKEIDQLRSEVGELKAMVQKLVSDKTNPTGGK